MARCRSQRILCLQREHRLAVISVGILVPAALFELSLLLQFPEFGRSLAKDKSSAIVQAPACSARLPELGCVQLKSLEGIGTQAQKDWVWGRIVLANDKWAAVLVDQKVEVVAAPSLRISIPAVASVSKPSP